MVCVSAADLVEQILVRLPVKSVIRMKSICKSWFHLISDPRFVKLHLHEFPTFCLFNLSAYGLSYRIKPPHLSFKRPRIMAKMAVDYHDLAEEDQVPWCVEFDALKITMAHNPFNNVSIHCIQLRGACNGLLLVSISFQGFFLWNPSTREDVFISPPIDKEDDEEERRRRFRSTKIAVHSGLGYNAPRDEYKAVVLYAYYGSTPQHVHSQLYVFSSKLGFWKRVKDHRLPFCVYGNNNESLGLTVNGYPHWMVHDGPKHESLFDIIMFFDTLDDKFKRVPTPVSWMSDYYQQASSSPTIALLQTRLCLVQQNHPNSCHDVWVMNEYGVVDSWTKLFVILPRSSLWARLYVPLGFINNGDEAVLGVLDKMKIVTYNLKTKEHKLVVGTTHVFGGLRSVQYVPSLVSPHAWKVLSP